MTQQMSSDSGMRLEPSGLRPRDVVARRPNHPVLLRGAIGHWPALKKWTPSHLRSLGNGLRVRLVLGNREAGPVRYAHSTFERFLQEEGNEGVYLKEFDFFGKLPELINDIDVRPFRRVYQRIFTYAWLGHSGSKTGLHYDSFDNFLFHVRGKKTVYVLDKRFRGAVPASERFDSYARLGALDLSSHEAMHAAGAQALAGYVLRVSLEPGDVLYIPKHWWHLVANDSLCISLSGFLATPYELLTTGLREEARRCAHMLGLYQIGNCTCHERGVTS